MSQALLSFDPSRSHPVRCMRRRWIFDVASRLSNKADRSIRMMAQGSNLAKEAHGRQSNRRRPSLPLPNFAAPA
jgi:hypothetical protein